MIQLHGSDTCIHVCNTLHSKRHTCLMHNKTLTPEKIDDQCDESPKQDLFTHGLPMYGQVNGFLLPVPVKCSHGTPVPCVTN